MNKIILGLSIVVVVLASILIYSYSPREEAVVINPIEELDCENINSEYVQNGCFVALAVKDSNEVLCDKVSNSDDKDLCYIKIARMEKDNSICDQINDTKYSRPKCYGEVIIASR
jgi:hypothetical protein